MPEGRELTRSGGAGAGGGGGDGDVGGLEEGGDGGGGSGGGGAPGSPGGDAPKSPDGKGASPAAAAAGSPTAAAQEDPQQQPGGSPSAGNDAAAAAADADAAQPALLDERRALRLPRASRVTSPLMDAANSLISSRGGAAESMPDLGAVLRALRARLAVAARYPKAAKRDVTALLAALPRCEAALMLKAQLEASCGRPREALAALGPLLAPPQAAAADGGEAEAAGGSSGGGVLTRPAARVALLNNLGVLHHQFGKHQTAAIYLSRALTESNLRKPGAAAPAADPVAAAPSGSGSGSKQGDGGAKEGEVRGGKFTGLWADHSHALHYNLGLQHLMLGNWEAALSCFDSAGQRFYMSPLLWLRMAEANVGWHCQLAARRREEGQRQSQGAEGTASHPLLEGVAGSGARRQLLLPAGHILGGSSGDGGRREAVAAAVAAEGSDDLWFDGPLGAAVVQLQTALALLQELKAEAAKGAEEAAAAAAAAATAALTGHAAASPRNGRSSSGGGANGDGDGSPRGGGWPGGSGGSGGGGAGDDGPRGGGGSSSGGDSGGGGGGSSGDRRMVSDSLPPEELEAIGQTIWSNLAYVHLLRDDPALALVAAQQLLACGGLGAERHYLGSCYAAEALCMLGRPVEAGEQLRAHLALFHGGGGAAAGGGGREPAGTASLEGLAASQQSDDDEGPAVAAAAEQYSLGNAAAAAALTGPAARAATLTNLAAVAAMGGELPEAQRLALQALAVAGGSGSSGSSSEGAAAAARLMLVYCELKRSDCAAALALLRAAGGAGRR